MVSEYVVLVLMRVLLPTGLLLSIALRPFGLSIIYLLLFLLAPLSQVPNSRYSFKGIRGKFLLLVLLVSILLILVHVAWHSVLAAFVPYGSMLEDNPLIEKIGLNLGLVSYSEIDPMMAVHYMAPELVMTATSLVVYFGTKRLVSARTAEQIRKDSKHQRYPLLTNTGKYICVLLMMLSGIMRPSVTSGIYFLVFIGCATAWALGRPLERGFAVIGRCLMAIMAVHVMVLIAYQSSWTINFYPPEKDFARYFGLTKLVIINETDPNEFIYEDTDDQAWATMASPLIILFTYFVLAIETRELFKPKAKRKSALTGLEAGKQNGSLLRGLSLSRASRRAVRDKWMSATKKARVAYPYKSSKVLRGNTSETTPLIQNLSVTTTKRSQFTRSQTNTRQLHQDSIGSVIFGDDDSVLDANEPTLKDDIIAAIIDFFQVLVRSSYIATTITMMAWSILFHSWLTFVFLMWANVVWLCQNQRSFMLKTSPILVFYAIMLLITQYVYGMDLTESELPSNITEVNLRQFGLKRPDGEACVPLLVKSMFTLVFWLTLRQRVQESQQRKQSAVITDMAAPLQLTISAAASVIETQHEEEGRSRLLRVLGDWLRSVCARYWIYVVVIMLFVIGIGIGGERMTIFRIIYMFLFLVFILMFQISWYWWRRLMYVFWITVIIYAMINLILIYVYQFDGCAKIIEHYLFINEKLQHDLGLEPYHPADLFVKLLTPTAFLIITIMQVHYFHKDFMAMSEPKTRTNTIYKEPSSSRPSNAGASTMKDDLPPLPLEEEGQTSYDAENSAMTEHERRSINMSSAHTAAKRSFARQSRSRSYAPSVAEKSSAEFVQVLVGALRSARDLVLQWRDKMFMYLDIHLFKVIMVALMLLCVFNVCAMNAPIMILISPALLMRPRQQRFCVLIISTLISIYFMAQMVYQIDYINHSHYDVNCSSEYSTTLLNNAQWVGFMKSSADRPLVTILKGHIALIVIFTLYSLVTYRQQTLRQLKVYPEYKSSDKMIFPNITRKEADIDLVHCIKYLINYGFYKFGVEITLICLMGVIGSRMDIYAVIYALWLLVLVSFQRTQQARIWNVFTVFITFIVPLQYMIAVGFIPMLCISYPWSGDAEQMKHVRNWLFLPYTAEPPNAIKLIFDYFLLLFASRQRRIFMIEKEKGDNYPGGSNSEARDMDWETSEFVNPVPDFLGFVGTWLDVLKRMIFLGMLWVTLAIMFMTGTNRVNLFSMGYLMGSFIFLWQGTDFYLLPKEAILKWWSWLLLYNVAVVVTKTLLQIPGCIFSATIQEHACWLVQLLGIGCVDKFAGGNIANFIKMSYAKNATCTVPQEDIGLAWDGVCFAFLILQRRLFHSYYFYRVIDESKATTVLASRGAELIEHLRLKQMRIQEDREVRILEKIKVKMEKIKANQKKIQGVITKESRHHDAGSEAGPSVRRAYTKRHEALHSGDYYMFDEFDDTDDHIKDEEDEELDIDAPKEMGIGKLVSTVIKTDLKHAVLLRRASAPNIRASLHPSPGSYPHSYPHESHPPTPQPSTAHERDIHLTERVADDRDSTMDDYAPVPETWLNKLKRYIETAWAFISSFLVSITCHVMKFSRDYRYVSRMLTLEKKILKENKSFGIGIREGSQLRWEPLPENIVQNRKLSDISVPEIRILAPSMERGLDASPASSRASRPPSPSEDDTSEHESAFSLQSSESQNVTALEDQDDSMFQQDRNAILHLTYAIWYAVLAHTDIVCYIMVFINQIQSATILSIPLPLMVFLWGTLTIPRPTKSFWVTLIAYTEVIVLIKSMFQFEILPWNQKAIPDNMPFTAPRIIGIERKFNYALYDLLLLLIMFLHRFMLKSLGLWKETTPEVELRDDTEYEVKPDDTQMLVEGQGAKVGRNYIDLHDRTGPEIEPESGVETERRKKALRASGGDEAGPSKRNESLDHYEVTDDKEPIIAVMTILEEPYNHYPKVMWLSLKRYLRPTQQFFKCMLAPGARVTADIYAYMFLCDFFNFHVVIFGFAAFGTHQGDGGVQAYLEENKVPIPFLVMLILQFVLIIIDRALYLRKFMLGKILFQYALIIGVHVWMFFVLPFITERTFNSLMPPKMWYLVKCIYLLLSAYQIRCGYPRRIIGNFLCKSYHFFNMVFYRCFMAVPFVFELRTLMDWIWTDTSMTLMDWLKMEDIFASVFLLKCSRYIEDEYPQPRGSKKSTVSKYLLGGGVLVFIIAIIWFPLVFFAFGNTVGEPNPPTDVTVKIRIGPFLPVYQMSAQSHNIDVYTEQDYAQLSNLYARDRSVQTFLSNYMFNDLAVITINPNSTMSWDISPPELARLEREVESNSSLQVKFTFVITHPSNNVQNPPTIEDSREVTLPAFIDDKRNPERETLYNMLTNKADPTTWLNVEELFPKFLKVFNKGTAKPASQLIPGSTEMAPRFYRDVQLRLEREGHTMYWRVREACSPRDTMAAIPMNNCDMLVLYTFNDKLFPETLNFISGSGIIGLYTTFVFLASRVIRGFFSGIYTKIMFDDLPNVDRVLQLCLDIYLVREALEMSLEEDLFAKLVFLYRSPETMIKWSRPREEETTEEQRALPPPPP